MMFVKSVYERILKRKISRIDEYLKSIRFKNKEIEEMYHFAIGSGKRFRPLLTMIACEAVGGRSEKIIPIACSIELLHKASLIHDDLIDNDEYRRGKKTFFKKYGKEKAVIMGDLLIAIGFENITRSNHLIKHQSLQTLITTFRLLATGELEEEILSGKKKVDESDIESVIYNKTAVLIETCFKIGVMLGNGTRKENAALTEFGKNIGLAFQTINDINNIDGTDQASKKKIRSDLFRKRKNLTLLHTIKNSSDKDRIKVNRILGKKKMTGKDVDLLCDIILRNKSLDYARNKVRAYLQEAKTSLDDLRPSVTRRILKGIIDEADSRWFWTTS